MLTLDAVARAIAHFRFETLVELLGMRRPAHPVREDTQFVFGRRLPDVVYRWCDDGVERWLAVEMQSRSDPAMPTRVRDLLVQMATRALSAARLSAHVSDLDLRVVEVRTLHRSRETRREAGVTLGGALVHYEVSNVLLHDDIAFAAPHPADAPLRALRQSATVDTILQLVADVITRWPANEDSRVRDYVLLLLGLVCRVRLERRL